MGMQTDGHIHNRNTPGKCPLFYGVASPKVWPLKQGIFCFVILVKMHERNPVVLGRIDESYFHKEEMN